MTKCLLDQHFVCSEGIGQALVVKMVIGVLNDKSTVGVEVVLVF